MANQEPRKLEPEEPENPPPPAPEHIEEIPKNVTEEKSVIPPPEAPPAEEKPRETKTLAVVESNIISLPLSFSLCSFFVFQEMTSLFLISLNFDFRLFFFSYVHVYASLNFYLILRMMSLLLFINCF